MLTPAEAEERIFAAVRPLAREDCPVGQAHGRVLRGDVRADRDLPPYDRVMLDGYALRAGALASGVRSFRVEATQAAGAQPGALGPAADACIEIMTGAALPAGADCVVPYEDTERYGPRVRVAAGAEVGAGNAVHRRGSDHRAGEVIVPAGTRLTGGEIAVAAACGCAALPVARLPRIAIVATGDELVEVDAPAAPHQIRRSNDYALDAALSLAGYTRNDRFLLRDSPAEIGPLLARLIADYDVLLVTGGVSKGKFDFLPAELDRQGVKRLFQGVAQRPGKPLWFGLTPRETPVFALPGNPVASAVCLRRYVLPALDRASGLAAAPGRKAVLAAPARFRPKLAWFLPVRVTSGPRAELAATPAPTNTSGDFAGLVGTDGFVELPAELDEFPAGFVAPYYSWT
jgi:molybdopterin molybdotransferase